jgi:hypothetical protein
LNQIISEVPRRGMFDLRLVLDSVYFFSWTIKNYSDLFVGQKLTTVRKVIKSVHSYN